MTIEEKAKMYLEIYKKDILRYDKKNGIASMIMIDSIQSKIDALELILN